MATGFDLPPAAATPGLPPRLAEPTAGDAAAERFGTGKLAERVAMRIEEDVRRDGWPVGRVLGSESELRERYQVSRAVLREAIRLVEHHQVAAMRRGPAGGLVVRAPDAGAATSAMVVYLEFVGATLEHLFTARRMIEPLAAALAAERITEDEVHRLRTELAEETAHGPNRDARARTRLHLVLAELSGNPALHLFIDVLLRLTSRYAHDQLANLPEDPTHPALTSSDVAHEALVSAVVSGDAARAQLVADEHLETLGSFFTGWRCTGQPAGPIFAISESDSSQEQKLAEVVAQALFREITGGGWAVGTVLGSEAALLERFGVSRAVLREAIRLLEYHSVAAMRRGPGGGLVVTEPDPTASVAAVALYLDYQGTETDDLRAVREAVELGALEQVAARVGRSEVSRGLRDLVRAPDPDNPFGSAPPEASGASSHRLHLELAELSGNPVLALFLRILITLWARRDGAEAAPDALPDTSSRPLPDSVAQAHRDVVEALRGGDRDLARHRLRRHLAAVRDWWL